jgi:hypothetical protein
MNTKASRQRHEQRLAAEHPPEQPTHRQQRKPHPDPPPTPNNKPRTPLPNPWLFNSEQLLRELDRVREMMLLVPASTHETYISLCNAIDAVWNLRDHLRELLKIHSELQTDFRRKGQSRPEARKVTPEATASQNAPARMVNSRVLFTPSVPAIHPQRDSHTPRPGS